MNAQAPRGPALGRALLGRIREILQGVDWLAEVREGTPQPRTRGGADATFIVATRKGRRAELVVHARGELRPHMFQALADSARRTEAGQASVHILAVAHVSDRMAELCRRAGWGWYDLAGNCRIEVPGLLLVERSGLPPVPRRPAPGANLSTPAAARVMRALLTPAHAGKVWTQRDLQQATFIPTDRGAAASLGLVNKVVKHLRAEGFIGEDRRGVRLRDPEGLLAAWSRAYRFDRHQRGSYFTLLGGDPLAEALGRVGSESGNMAVYAAFSAAERQAPHVSQAKTWIYLAADALGSLVEHAQAKPVDSGENLVVLIPDDPGVFVSFSELEDIHIDEKRLHCTDPVQTYIDLLHGGGRGEEAAQALLEQRLLPAWKEAGIA